MPLESNHPNISIEEFNLLFESLKNWGRWGQDDNKGTLNYITSDKIRSAAALVKSGRSVSMSIPINTVAGPDNPNPAIHYMANTHDIDIGSGELRFATDFLGCSFMATATPILMLYAISPIKVNSIMGFLPVLSMCMARKNWI